MSDSLPFTIKLNEEVLVSEEADELPNFELFSQQALTEQGSQKKADDTAVSAASQSSATTASAGGPSHSGETRKSQDDDGSRDKADHKCPNNGPSLKVLIDTAEAIPDPHQREHITTPSEGLH